MGRSAFLASLAIVAPSAHAWDRHATLMPYIMKGLPAEVISKLQRSGTAPCPSDDQNRYDKLAEKLNLKRGLKISPTHPSSAGTCGPLGAMSAPRPLIAAKEVIAGNPVDDPDNGMDRDLPESADPKGERKFMGGTTGPTSQGFRHMYFGGWKWTKPIATFQVPTQTIGQAPERAAQVANQGAELNRAGNLIWGARTLAWAMHYLQDLSQPFHSTQIPDLSMVPWFVLLSWPPSKAFGSLVTETTRTIGNFHYAYEGYTLHRMTEGTTNPFIDCLDRPRDYSNLPIDRSATADPATLAKATAQASVAIAAEMGEAVVGFFGAHLKSREFDLPNEKGRIDYADMAVRPDKTRERHRLHEVTCRALSNGIIASQKLLEWAYR